PALVKEGDLQLLAEEQVLEEEALAAAQGVDERGQEKHEELDHRGRIADRRHLAGGAAQTFAPLQVGVLPSAADMCQAIATAALDAALPSGHTVVVGGALDSLKL